MDPRISFASEVIMSVLSVKLILVSTICNGSFLAIFARFKNLRNFQNILFANLAVIDFLNALLNLPIFVLFYVLQASWLKGITWAVISSSLQLEFALLNMVSLFALQLDRFLALYLDLKYFTWKTPEKAYLAVSLTWLICTMIVALASVPLFDMGLDELPFLKSRRIIFQQRKWFIASITAIFLAATIVLGILASYAIYQKKIQVRVYKHFYGLQSNLYITTLYIAVTLYITVTEQLPENRALIIFTVKLTCI